MTTMIGNWTDWRRATAMIVAAVLFLLMVADPAYARTTRREIDNTRSCASGQAVWIRASVVNLSGAVEIGWKNSAFVPRSQEFNPPNDRDFTGNYTVYTGSRHIRHAAGWAAYAHLEGYAWDTNANLTGLSWGCYNL